jgi:hypothetical protein
MKYVSMAQRKDRPSPVKPREPEQATDTAFDIWLNRSLHQLFDDVAREPVPEDLLRIVEEDRNK